VLGHPVPAEARAARRHIGVVPQEDNLDPDFTVLENLRVYASYFGLSGPSLQRRIDELLEFAALSDRARSPIASLSGGMRRRLSLVRSLLNEPELLVLDEPTTGLDPAARQAMWQRLRALRSRGLTLLLTTHYMEEAQRLCDRVVVLDRGRILAMDSPVALIRTHIEPQVIEVHGPDLESWHLRAAPGLDGRWERAGETLYYYAQDERPLLQALAHAPQLSYLHRPANLEDVFLKLTGRDLREA
jgi:lipooligosaccharide transport system ATP-binding protein